MEVGRSSPVLTSTAQARCEKRNNDAKHTIPKRAIRIFKIHTSRIKILKKRLYFTSQVHKKRIRTTTKNRRRKNCRQRHKKFLRYSQIWRISSYIKIEIKGLKLKTRYSEHL